MKKTHIRMISFLLLYALLFLSVFIFWKDPKITSKKDMTWGHVLLFGPTIGPFMIGLFSYFSFKMNKGRNIYFKDCDPNKLTIDHYDCNKSRSEMPNKVDTMIFWWIRYVKFFKWLGISYFERDFIRTVQKNVIKFNQFTFSQSDEVIKKEAKNSFFNGVLWTIIVGTISLIILLTANYMTGMALKSILQKIYFLGFVITSVFAYLTIVSGLTYLSK
ncbi:hypothetical protein [Candidatus Phytoplasma pruni]|uniref:Uncharacterized protein n=1 Tax=Candidatus Phytoplasma pruni TaxID=479893 RepID=A0A851HH95_9MOLU|nr:hypothetical protein [Candidatus Phytoplasma pruni]NWN45654.1 hypothetical protein [Candidatus Phytoplasma pruni]